MTLSFATLDGRVDYFVDVRRATMCGARGWSYRVAYRAPTRDGLVCEGWALGDKATLLHECRVRASRHFSDVILAERARIERARYEHAFGTDWLIEDCKRCGAKTDEGGVCAHCSNQHTRAQ